MATVTTYPSVRCALPYRCPAPGFPTVRGQPSAVNRRRAAVAFAAITALGILLGVGSLAGAGRAAEPAARSATFIADRSVPVSSITYIIQPGDTLWALARRQQPEGDIRPLVAQLRAAVGSAALVPGQHISLPFSQP